MKVFINTVRTYINTLEPTMKGLLIGMLVIFDTLCIMQIIKTHYNPKKTVFKIGQFIVLAILIVLTLFVFFSI